MVISDQDLPLDRASLPFSHGRGVGDTGTIRTLLVGKKEEVLFRQQVASVTQHCSPVKIPDLVCPLKVVVVGHIEEILYLTLVFT